MKVSYRNKLLDIIIFNIVHLSRSPFMLGFLAIILIVIGWSNWQLAAESAAEYSQPVKIVVFAILQLLCIAVLGLLMLVTLILSHISKMNKTLLADTTLILDSDYITSETQYARAELKWDAVQKLVRTRSHVFMYLMQHGAIVIPRRAFNSDDSWEQFWLACQAGTTPTKNKAG